MKNPYKSNHDWGRGVALSSLNSVITDILRSRDFTVSERGGDFLARKDEVEVLFCIVEEVNEAKVKEFLDRTSSFLGKRVIASLVPLPDSIARALPSGIIVWDRQAIEHELGRVHIERILGNRDHGLVDEFIADDYPRMVTAEELERLGVLEVGERIVKPVLEPNDVQEIGSRTVGGFKFRLELVPHYLYRYACALFIDEVKLGMQDGQVAINALTHKPTEWPDSTEFVFNLEQSHQRLEPAIDPDESRTLALDEITRIHSSERDVVRDSGSVTVTERKKVSPKRDDIVLESMGIYYLPVWCVEGVKGVMILNASTGKVISEDYYSKDLS
ncbi:MAG TPA: hypothetical protein VLH13_02170 [Methanomassiliicoccales archaeon]|nr:hypothetical protein [Methanomassiliicoccales archaeon]